MKLQPVQIPPRPQGLSVKAFALAEPRFEVRVSEARIEVFDQIGGDGVTPAKISGALRQIGNRRVTVAINSPGGLFHDGLAIFNLLVGHSAGVTTEVLGIAASAAALVAVAGDDVRMAKASQLMVHRASGGILSGTARDMRQVADVLDKIDATMIGIFVNRTGLDIETISSMVDQDTFLNSDEAIQYGFADALLNQNAMAAPRVSASGAAPATKTELEEQLRGLGLSRKAASHGAAAAWAVGRGNNEPSPPDLDTDAVARVLAGFNAALVPSHPKR